MEFRQKQTIGGILLYMVSTIFVCYLSFKRIVNPATWNALFWIIILFSSVTAVSKSFLNENRARQLYLYTLVDARAVILSKIIYNSILMVILSNFCLFIYCLLIGNIIQDLPMFIIATILGNLGFASLFSLVSAIAAKTDNSVTLVAILGFPIILPMLMTLIILSKNAIDGIDWSVNWKYISVLSFINVIIVALSYLLFPYLWRD